MAALSGPWFYNYMYKAFLLKLELDTHGKRLPGEQVSFMPGSKVQGEIIYQSVDRFKVRKTIREARREETPFPP